MTITYDTYTTYALLHYRQTLMWASLCSACLLAYLLVGKFFSLQNRSPNSLALTTAMAPRPLYSELDALTMHSEHVKSSAVAAQPRLTQSSSLPKGLQPFSVSSL